MNFSTEDSVVNEKKKLGSVVSNFLKNPRILFIVLTAVVIIFVFFSLWIKSPEYEVLYNNLSSEDGGAIINQLNQMQIPYQFTDASGQISVPKNKVYEIRLHLAENNLPKNGGIGFELLDKEKFGMSQFNEKINYQRALEGELARTITRIKIVKNARIHIAFPESSLFLQNKKPSSASVVLELQTGYKLDPGQIDAIQHLISSSISNLPIENITIVDQLGTLLNQTSLESNQVSSNAKLQYSKDIELHYSNRIKNILEPLVGTGNVYAQVTAQIDFNSKEKTEENYSPNTDYENQSIRSHQTNVHNQTQNHMQVDPTPNSTNYFNKNKIQNHPQEGLDTIKKNTNSINQYKNIETNIHRDNTINYELDHSVLHTKMNIGEVQRLSAAVIINFTKDKNGKNIPLTPAEIQNIEQLTREAIGYSIFRGDSIHIVNSLFFKNSNNNKFPVKINHINTSTWSDSLLSITPWFVSLILFFLLLKKYFCPVAKKNNIQNIAINKEKQYVQNNTDIEKDIFQLHTQKNKNVDRLIHQLCNISNQNPRTIALIIREWMSNKI